MRRGRLPLGWDEVEGFGLADENQAVRAAHTLGHVISVTFLEVIRSRPKHDLLLTCFDIGHRALHYYPVIVACMQMNRADETFGQTQKRAVGARCGIAPDGPQLR